MPLRNLPACGAEAGKGAQPRPPRALSQQEMQPATSLDDLGAGEDRLRYRQPERLRRFQVDDQIEPRRLLDRQIAGLDALEDLVDIRRPTAHWSGTLAP